MRWWLLGLLVWADVVHLTTGRSISGTVESESPQEVVVRTGSGRVTLPRRLVARIEREDAGRTALHEAEQRALAGDREGAAALYRRLAEGDDAEVARAARSALARLEASARRAERGRRRPATPWPAPAGVAEEALDAARLALSDGDAARALGALEALREVAPDDLGLWFLAGRARAALGEEDAARAAYREVSGLRGSARALDWEEELARRAVSGALGVEEAGVGEGWSRWASRRFVVFSEGERPGWTDGLESRWEATLRVLEQTVRDVGQVGRVQVVVHATEDACLIRDGLSRRLGHGARRLAPDGVLVRIDAYPEFPEAELRHALAHAVLAHTHPELPVWALEGAACYAEGPEARAAYRQEARGGDPFAWLEGERVRGGGRRERRAFDAGACCVFETWVSLRDGVGAALGVAGAIQADGVRDALLDRGIPRGAVLEVFESLAR